METNINPVAPSANLLSALFNTIRMKFFQNRIVFTIILFLALSLQPLLAQGNRDFMRETGKIYVVVGVILIILLGIAVYLLRLDRKLTNIEHQLNDNDNEWKN
jgi:CcmD family protein